ncbi:MAG: T9SS type A sorting domain-containing protein [candidate division Zixibacteria bacterium]|nr:T9SS type A sorting domain-containing protein [candidate division Zixibacteria bacterium]
MKISNILSCLMLVVLMPSIGIAALTPPTHPLFDGDAVHEINLTFNQTDWWDSLRTNFEGLDDPLYLAAGFDWEDIHLDSVGVRFKGSSSYYGNNTDKKSFKIDIDEYVDGQEIYGLDKLNLSCGFLDASFVRERSCYELCKAAGLPMERTNFAALYINSEYYGVYTIVEQYDQEFIESRFGAGEEGNLWKGDPSGTLEYLGPLEESYYDDYELKTNEETNDWSSLVQFVDVLNNTPIIALPDTISHIVDVNSALALLAVDNLTVNLDSYAGRCANYYMYNRDLDNRFVFANWDLNESWGIFNMYGLSISQLQQLDPFWISTAPGEVRPLAEQLWQVSEYEEVYLGHIQKLMAGAAQPDTLVARMEEMRDLIRPYVYAEVSPRRLFTSSQFETAMSTDIYDGPRVIPALETFVRNRDTYLRTQIGEWTPIEGLVINELMAKNSTTIADEYGDFDDWIEIANIGLSPVSLNGLALTDNVGDLDDYFYFPDTTLSPGTYLIIWADEETGEGTFHTPFKLDADGENVYLIDNGVVFDEVTFPEISQDISYGRWPDGNGEWQLLSLATPGAENQNPENPEEVYLFINEFMALNDNVIQDEMGEYEDWAEIYNPGPDPVEMGGLFLTDDLTNTTQWSFPDTTLAVGEFLLVWCDNDEGDGPLHTNFKLSGGGEEIGLFGRLDAGNGEIDSYIFSVQSPDTSEGRQTDGGEPWVFFSTSTPGTSNGSSATAVSIDMIPDYQPIDVPAGGSFSFTGTLRNNTGELLHGDVWIMLRLPTNNMYGPIEQWYAIPLQPYEYLSYPGVTQYIPTFAMRGDYDYIAYAGLYPSVIVDSASFDFTVIDPITNIGSNEWDLFNWFVDELSDKLPTSLNLYSNYPNPFNAQTTIRFNLTEESNVTLSVYNLYGQKVETLINKNMESRQYEITWDASTYSSGVYFYKLTTGDKTYTKLMTLLK